MATPDVVATLSRTGQATVSELSAEVDRSQSAVSHHLSRLSDLESVVRELTGCAVEPGSIRRFGASPPQMTRASTSPSDHQPRHPSSSVRSLYITKSREERPSAGATARPLGSPDRTRILREGRRCITSPGLPALDPSALSTFDERVALARAGDAGSGTRTEVSDGRNDL